MSQRAVFLDRDGVLIREVDYLRRAEQLRLMPGAARAVARLRRAGFKIIVVTNQSGVARGYLSRETLEAIHALMERRLLVRGARLDGLYYCPHHPRRGCPCRKPRTGMIKAAARRFGLNLKASYLVGDTTADVRTARNAGCRAILVRTGKGGRDGLYKDAPDAACGNLAAAAAWILGRK